MTGAQALAAVRAAGGGIELDGADLVLTVTAQPPPHVLDALSRHKAEIIALLQARRDTWDAEDWRAHFDERAGAAGYDGGLTRIQAENKAYESCVVEWMNRHPVTSPPGRCLGCSGADRAGDVLLPFGVASTGHAWVHSRCWPAWHQAREAEAVAALKAMGIEPRQRLSDDDRNFIDNELGQ